MTEISLDIHTTVLNRTTIMVEVIINALSFVDDDDAVDSANYSRRLIAQSQYMIEYMNQIS